MYIMHLIRYLQTPITFMKIDFYFIHEISITLIYSISILVNFTSINWGKYVLPESW